MIEITVINRLNEEMPKHIARAKASGFIPSYFPDEIKAHTQDPNTEDYFVRLGKTSGGIENHYIKNAQITLQSYALSELDAAMLNEIVKNIMADIIEIPSISRCKLNSDYDFTDTRTKRFRYQAVFDLVYTEPADY